MARLRQFQENGFQLALILFMAKTALMQAGLVASGHYAAIHFSSIQF